MRVITFAAATLLLAGSVFAAEPVTEQAGEKAPPSPEEMQQLMEPVFGAMVPMMGKMAEVTIEAQLQVAEKPETAVRLATFKKRLYDALVKQGFTKQEAFQIMLQTGLPAAMPGMK